MNETESLALARRLGELEGAAFEAALVARERALRSERLGRIALTGDKSDLPIAYKPTLAWRDLPEIESRLRELTRFHHAVVSSRGWHYLQQVRRLFGRKW